MEPFWLRYFPVYVPLQFMLLAAKVAPLLVVEVAPPQMVGFRL
jgi:hypothetical protein